MVYVYHTEISIQIFKIDNSQQKLSRKLAIEKDVCVFVLHWRPKIISKMLQNHDPAHPFTTVSRTMKLRNKYSG